MSIQSKSKVGQNEKCPCESGLKFKHCHGDPLKQAVCNRVANEKMLQLIRQEQRKRIIIIQQKECQHCNGTGIVEGDGQGYRCSKCQYITDEERIEVEYKRLTKEKK